MVYQGPRCNVVVLLPDEILIIALHKMCDVPNAELHRAFLAVSNRRGGSNKKQMYLSSAKKLRVL